MRSFVLFTTTLLACAFAKTVVITVGGNTTSDAGAVFKPQTVKADLGDVVVFNFTQGNHTAIQADFASPCIPIHISNVTLNGFDSAFRDAGNGTAITQLPVTITDPNATIWFFDWNTCAKGGVGGINVNESSYQTIDGFARNAVRLNGTGGGSSTSKKPTSTGSSNTPASSQTGSSARTDRNANQALVTGFAIVAPMLLGLAALSI